jgi:hypothetical protein
MTLTKIGRKAGWREAGGNTDGRRTPEFYGYGAAMARAAPLLLDGEPKILRDDLALGLSGVENEATFQRPCRE